MKIRQNSKSFLNLMSLVTYLLIVLVVVLSTTRSKPTAMSNLADVRLIRAITAGLHIPDEPDASPYLLGVAERIQERPEAAVYWLRKLTVERDALGRWQLAKAYHGVGDWQAALHTLTDQTDAESFLFRQILTQHLPTLTDSQDHFWRQQVLDWYDTDMTYYASQLISNQQYERAKSWIVSIPDWDQSADALLLLGSVEFYDGSLDEALQLFADAYQLEASDYAAYWYGRSMSIAGHPERAISLLKEAVDKTKSDVAAGWYLRELAEAYARVRRCQESETSLLQAEDQDKSSENQERIDAMRQVLSVWCPTLSHKVKSTH